MERDVEKKKSSAVGFFIVGILLAMIIIWFSMANISYDSASPQFPFRTAGRFAVFSPFFLGLAFCYAALLHYLFRRLKKLIAWTAMFLISAYLLFVVIDSALPHNQIQIVFGPEAASQLTISKLRISDTFQDGRFFIGIIRGPNNLMRIIEKEFPLKMEENAEIDPSFTEIFNLHGLEPITVYFDDHRTFYVSKNSNEIIFKYRECTTF